MIKNNLLMLSLENYISKHTKQKLADSLDLFFADINDILEYNLIDNSMLETCGKKYFDKETKKVLHSVSQYENSLVSGNINLFLNDDTIKQFKEKFIVVYMQYDKKQLQKMQEDETQTSKDNKIHHNNLLAFEEEDMLCKSFSDITIPMTEDENENIESIKKSLLKFVEGRWKILIKSVWTNWEFWQMKW